MPSVRKILLAAGACILAGGPLAGQSRDGKQVMSEELVRDLSGTGSLAGGTGLSFGRLTTSSSLAGEKIPQTGAVLAYEYSFATRQWDIGEVRPLLLASLGGMSYDETLSAPGFAQDRTEGFSVGSRIGGGATLRPWRHTVFHALAGYGHLFAKNDYEARTPFSQSLSGQLDGHTRNWFANAATSVTRIGVTQDIPFDSAAWTAPVEAGRPAGVRFSTNLASTSILGFWGSTASQRQYLSSYAWSGGVEVLLPVAAAGGGPISAAPFLKTTVMLGDGRRSISSQGYFHEAGCALSWRPGGGTGELRLSGSVLWGGDASGWQASLGWRF